MLFFKKSKKKKQDEVQKYWTTPKMEILSGSPGGWDCKTYSKKDIEQIFLASGCPCKCIKTISAPQVITYHFELDNVADITKLKKPITILSAMIHVRVDQVNSDVGHFALQVPAVERALMPLKTCLLTETFDSFKKPQRACLGLDTTNHSVVLSVSDMPHMLIAGATGSGKSVLLNSIILSMLYSCFPTDTRFVMIDPKKVELSKYEGLPHLYMPIVKEYSEAIQTLETLCDVMDRRYILMAKKGCKKASEMNLPALVVIIDELADLMLTSKYECEQSIIRLAQLGRAAGIHLIVATQRPTVNVITGLIKSNIPCKIALQTSSVRDSINILDHQGAESLLGKGDALLKLPDRVEEIRFQSAYVSDEDIENVVHYWKYDSVHERQN